MTRLRLILWVATALVAAIGGVAARAQEFSQGTVTVRQPWSRETAPGLGIGVGYLQVLNHGPRPDLLLAVRTTAAERVEIHQSSMDRGMMKMRRVEQVAIPAGAEVAFEPGGLHLMLIGLKAPLVAGKSLPLVLQFRDAGAIKVDFEVRNDL
jgi:copper(I)-binding protein